MIDWSSFDDRLKSVWWCFEVRSMIDWSPFDDTLEGKTSSNEMNFLVIFKEDTKTFNDNHYLNPHRTPSLNREGWGGSPVGLGRGRFPTLHRNPLLSRKLHWFVKCFIILKHFEDNYICSPAAVAAVSLLGIKTSPADSFYAATISSPNLWIWLMISCSRSFDGFLKPLM